MKQNGNGVVWEKKLTAIRRQIKWWVQKVDKFLNTCHVGPCHYAMACPIAADTEDAPECEGDLPIYWISSCRQPTIDGPPMCSTKVSHTEECNCQEKNIPTSKHPKTHLDLTWWDDSQTDVSKWTNSTDIWYGETKCQESNSVEVKRQLKSEITVLESLMIQGISAGTGKILEEIPKFQLQGF